MTIAKEASRSRRTIGIAGHRCVGAVNQQVGDARQRGRDDDEGSLAGGHTRRCLAYRAPVGEVDGALLVEGLDEGDPGLVVEEGVGQ